MIDRKRGYYDEALETMPAAKRAQAQREMLRETVLHAYGHAPATRRKMDDAGVRPGDVKEPADLRKIPLTRKADIKHIQKGEPPFGGLAAVPPRAMRRIYVSPGPTFDPEGRDATHWRWEKPFIAAGFREGDIVQNTFMYHFSPAGLMFDEALQRIGCTVIPAGVGNTELQAQVMKELNVTGYVGTPSFLMTILEKAKEMGFTSGDGLSLQVGLVTGEMFPESLRARFRDEFGVQVRQCYGTADVGSLGYECHEAKGMHVPDEIFLEMIDPATGDPVPPGAIGEVVVTLPNRTYPLVRFATGDLSILSDDPCQCGRTSPRLPPPCAARRDTARLRFRLPREGTAGRRGERDRADCADGLRRHRSSRLLAPARAVHAAQRCRARRRSRGSGEPHAMSRRHAPVMCWRGCRPGPTL